ncbi:MAG: UV DNA damage repair endonuclease UvsE [Candidatus Lokiarchaeota archaeon]|nr:UV DNA damage repair endonuclease UvsE [Candidatus Lokiarchaeota archaeon]MBD3198863.1 UV DNA damage repair endonuclease UvsE [Candidatus Lokiarchaeota archaeon]
MKIGYPCINLSLECRSSHTFRLKNYSKEKLKKTVKSNLKCLLETLKYNINHKILFFRITSDLVPFASHQIMDFNWKKHFSKEFSEIGNFIKKKNIRITMHPGQYTVLNSNNEGVYKRSLEELIYHIDVLDLMKLDKSCKVQLHVGGVYGEKENSLNRFIERYHSLSNNIKERLVIENDDKSYNLKDCLQIYRETQIPIIFDVYHHMCNNSGESIEEAFQLISHTWEKEDGIPIIHYSSEHPHKGKPSHSEHIDLKDFAEFIQKTNIFDYDLMLEIKDKEQSALRVIKILENDPRLYAMI